jgi:transcriptional regulator
VSERAREAATMPKVESDTLYGTLNLLILKSLAAGPLHGLAILHALVASSGEVVHVEEGALYPALHRLERDGLVAGEWGTSPKGRRAKLYRLTPKGRRQLDRGTERWLRHARAVAAVLDVRKRIGKAEG